jgi:phosphoribosylanthranilate isomerase
MTPAIKICGIKTAAAIDAAVRSGATHIGFNFFDASPRFVSTATASALAGRALSLTTVALTVDAGDELLERIVREAKPSLLQLHGRETPERVRSIKSQFRLPVMKAIAIASPQDVNLAHDFDQSADMLLFDAKPGELPGGNGLAFDWTLIASEAWHLPWMLSGGLTHQNVAEAIKKTGATCVDVSSGVEKVRGEKDPILIERFVAAAKTAFSESSKP